MTAPPDTPNDRIQWADLDWEGGEAVRSRQFGDVYFSDHGGLEETQHVFLGGNDLLARLAALDAPHFTVGELGFGTGLNILALWQAWRARGHERGHLHVFSVEGFPLTPTDFALAQKRIATRWPALEPLCRAMADAWPVITPGFHRLHLDEDVTLTLAIGEVGEMLAAARFRADAWFLDGFSPALNGAMWREEILLEVARLSAPEATAATFTVAGAVRRGLQAAGFALEKTPGFGRKREMLRARLDTSAARPPSPAPWVSNDGLRPVPAGTPVAILGAGIAGASLAWHLRREGRAVTVHDPAGAAAGASGNPAGLVMPRLDLGETPARQFYLDSWLYAVRLIDRLEAATGAEIFTSRGGLMLGLDADASDRHRKIAAAGLLPETMLRAVGSAEARELAQADLALPDDAIHLWIPKAGTIRPARFVAALLGDCGVDSSVPDEAAVIVDARGPLGEAGRLPVLTPSRGQIDVIDLAPPACAVTFGNYIAPLDGRAVTGATYEALDRVTGVEPREADSKANLAAAAQIMPGFAAARSTGRRAAIRAVTADRHPVAGPLPDETYYREAYAGLRTGVAADYPPARFVPGRFVLTGLGSRGLVTAPLCAAEIAGLVNGTVSPLMTRESALIHPGRFMARALKRREV